MVVRYPLCRNECTRTKNCVNVAVSFASCLCCCLGKDAETGVCCLCDERSVNHLKVHLYCVLIDNFDGLNCFYVRFCLCRLHSTLVCELNVLSCYRCAVGEASVLVKVEDVSLTVVNDLIRLCKVTNEFTVIVYFHKCVVNVVHKYRRCCIVLVSRVHCNDVCTHSYYDISICDCSACRSCFCLCCCCAVICCRSCCCCCCCVAAATCCEHHSCCHSCCCNFCHACLSHDL